MNFSDFVLDEAIITELKGTTKEEVVREMVQSLVRANGVSSSDAPLVVDSILRREELGSTGIGNGIAVPHTKNQSVENQVGVIAIGDKDGVDFDSIDGKKVNLFFMLVSPPDRPGEHLRALEYITQRLRNASFVDSLRHAATLDEVKKILAEADGTDNK